MMWYGAAEANIEPAMAVTFSWPDARCWICLLLKRSNKQDRRKLKLSNSADDVGSVNISRSLRRQLEVDET